MVFANTSEKHGNPGQTRIRLPKQGRSRNTLERIGRALESLLNEKSFELVTIAEVVQRAGVSTGSFYGRFAGKSALLLWLEEHYFSESRRTMEWALDPARWRTVPLPDVIEGCVRIYLKFLEEHGNLLRPIALENRRNPRGELAERSREVNKESYRLFVSLILERRRELPSVDLEGDAAFALATLYALSHELILFKDAGLQQLKDLEEREKLVRQLVRVILAYLTSREAPHE